MKYVLRHALDVGRRQIPEDVELAIGGRDVVVDDDGVGQLRRLSWFGLPLEDVVAQELVLRALQLALGDRLAPAAGRTPR